MKSLFLVLLFHTTIALAAPTKNILVFGDSLSVSYGVPLEQGWAQLLAQKITDNKRPYAVINASVSGETTAGGLSRLAEALRQHHPAIVVLELGANDGLRGLPTDVMHDNLLQMVRSARQQKAQVLLVGMKLPPNYGVDYTARFAQAFADIAKHEKVAFLPFLLEPFAGQRDAFQADNLHPTAAAQPALLSHVWTALLPLLK
jgi:acyl-CoA thioesterase-1